MKRSLGLAASVTAAMLAVATLSHGTRDVAPPVGLPAAVVDSDYHDDGRPATAKVELGRLLFFDKVLSGNRNIACASCHHPELATTDGLALGLGEGPSGLGPERRVGSSTEAAVHERVPRNSPALFNLGAREFEVMFHDGRVEADPNGYYEGGFITPAKWKLPRGLDSVLAAQAMFPVTSPTEMAGQKGENPVADAVSLNNAAGRGGAWELLAARLQAIPEYVDRFGDAFPDQVERAGDITYVLAANAIAAFEAEAFRADQSPFDAYLRGDRASLDREQQRGMALFYGKAGCADCHSGAFQTDHDFHAIAMPQLGPGKADGSDAAYWSASGLRAFLEDFGRGRVTVRPEDQHKFRTPSLRNVELTGPWGHDGAYDRLEEIVRHHLDPVAALERYDVEATELPALRRVLETVADGARWHQEWLSEARAVGHALRDGWVQGHPDLRGRIAAANELAGVELSDSEVSELVAFLASLTDPSVAELVSLVPETVPSGLAVHD